MNILEFKPRIDAKLIDDMAKAYQAAQVLFTAIDYDIFTLLKKPKTAREISDEMGTDFEITKKFLNALVALNLLSETDGKYTITTISETFLVRDSPFYQGNLVKLYAAAYDAWSKLGQALKTGVIQKPDERKNAFDKTFILAMAEASMRGPLQRVVEKIRDIPEFKKAKKLLDLGGGHGLYAIAFAQINPDLEAIVFDLPPVIEVTKEFISQYGMEERVKVMAGDFDKDDIGEGYDVIFVSHSAFYHTKETIHEPLEKIYEALNKDGNLVSNHWMLDNGKKSITLALWDLWLSVLGHPHYVYTVREFIDLLQEKRFSDVHVIDITTSEDPSMIVIAKKGGELKWKRG